MNARHFHRLRPGILGFVSVVLLWLGTGRASGAPVTWESVFEWIQRDWPEVPQMTTAELSRRLRAPGERPVLIDTRTREEYDVSHLPGAVWAETPAQIRAALHGEPPGRTAVLYCSVGVRSSKAAAGLLRSGRGNVFNLRGSIFQWANEGRAVERDGKPAAQVHPFDRKWGALLERKFHADSVR